MYKFISMISLLVLGFLAYPALFVPLMHKYCPQVMDSWIQLYAEYLKVFWGF